MREILRRFNSGEQIPAHDFNQGGLDIFSSHVWPSVIREQTTRQVDFDGEMWYRKVRPLIELTPEKEHTLRVETIKTFPTPFVRELTEIEIFTQYNFT